MVSMPKARIAGTGRSDFPNQVINALGIAGVSRAGPDLRARTITDEKAVAQARPFMPCEPE